MKKIYISKNYKGQVIGVFLSESKDLVNAYHLGAGDSPQEIEEIDLESDMIGMSPLFTLVTSFEKKGYELNDSDTYTFVKRGH